MHHPITCSHRHVGEWYDTATKPIVPYEEQKAKTVHDIWVTVGLYVLFATVSGAAICYNRALGKL